MKHRRLAPGTCVHVGSILITAHFGNMKISKLSVTGRALADTLTVERADIDDFIAALDQHLAGGKTVTVGSIMVAQAWSSLKITTTHTPSNTILIAPDSIDDLTAALAAALAQREGSA